MGFNKLMQLIEDDKLKGTIQAFADIESPYIITETLALLEDDSPMYNIITDSNKVALARMMNMYFNRCYFIYSDDIGLDKILPYGKMEVYKIDARDGIRYATANEVANGVRGLIPNTIYPAGEEYYKLLCLLFWSFTGRSYYYRQAGYSLEYDKEGKVTTSFYTMLHDCASQLMQLFRFVDDTDHFDKVLKIIKKMRKSNGYKYASFAKDEVEENVTIKQLVYNICRSFPHDSDNKEYRKALALAIKSSKNNVKLTPYEVSFLREVYLKHASDTGAGGCSAEVDEQLKSDCELLLQERYSGKINQNHFCYKIIATLKKNNYSRCSEKQYMILKDALEKIGSKQKDNKNTEVTNDNGTYTVISEDMIDKSLGYTGTDGIVTDGTIDMTLKGLSDAIGNGLGEED